MVSAIPWYQLCGGENPLDDSIDRYQGIADTIVQLFTSQASVLMTRVDRIQHFALNGSNGWTHNLEAEGDWGVRGGLETGGPVCDAREQ